MKSLILALGLAFASAANAQTAPVVSDLLKDIDDVHQKFVALAKATPAEKLAWRPGTGVRSAGEVLLHVASDNYLIPSAFGVAIPAATKIDAKNMKTLGDYERQSASREQIVAMLDESFTHLKAAMAKTTAADLTKPTSLFGMNSNGQAIWILATTHLHEHLGQSIAYARTNGIVPPWSK